MKLATKFLIAFVFWTVPFCAAASDAELHAARVYEGNNRTGDRVHGPEARVHVDRPRKNVTLVLLDYGPLRWFVTTS